MEFNEKLQSLRKGRGLTQEELAEILYVSRTAVSKWESGRGLPNIDSLKGISEFFGISIDELLSGESLLNIAEKEKNSDIKSIFDWLLCIIDLFSPVLIFTPLYPDTVDGYVYAVNLLRFSEVSAVCKNIYLIMIGLLFVTGAVKLIAIKLKSEKTGRTITEISVTVSVAIVMFLIIIRIPYAAITAFIMLISKGAILLKYVRTGK